MRSVDRDRHQSLGETDKRIIDALLSLMRERYFFDITVKEIAERAGVDRRTLYRHFPTKVGIFEVYCQSVFAEFGAYMERRALTSYGFAKSYFEFWLDHAGFIKMMQKHDLLGYFLRNYDGYMFQVARQAKPWNAEKSGRDFDAKIRYHFLYGMGGLWGMCNRWVIGGCKESPEELAQYVVAYFTESYKAEPGCQHYAVHGTYPYDPCYVTPNPVEPPDGWAEV